MAHTAHRDQRMMEEIQIPAEELQRLAARTAELIRAAQNVVFFTGAGISTSAGIPDYRGPQGVWTLAAQHRERDAPTVPMSQARPTLTHMAMVELQRRGKLQCVISQNVDGLHRKSGIPAETMCELHGNSNMEECATCGKLHARDIHIHGDNKHFTGRKCSAVDCNGYLRDTIINFGENLSTLILEKAFAQSERADVHICLGSSLTVSPACDLPRRTRERGGKVVICNLQRTPLDSDSCDVRVHAKTDEFMRAVMEHLGFPIPAWTMHRTVTLAREAATRVRVAAVYPSTDIPMTAFAKLYAVHPPAQIFDYTVDATAMNEIAPVFDTTTATGGTNGDDSFSVVCESFGEYREPTVTLTLPAAQSAVTYDLTWDLIAPSWKVTQRAEVVRPNLRGGNGASSRVDGLKDHRGNDYTGWFAVTPVRDCPHTSTVCFADGMTFDVNAPCADCGNVGENMLCLCCGFVACGRHVQGHMLKHREHTQHAIVAGFMDLSLWCYECEVYIEPRNARLAPFYRLLHRAKFNEDDPAQAVVSSAAAAPAAASQRGGRHQPPAAAAASTAVAAPPPPSFGSDASQGGAASWTESIQQALASAAAAVSSTISGAAAAGGRNSSAASTITPADVAGGFSVDPLRSCPHCSGIAMPPSVDVNAPCAECGNVGENMVCLSCAHVACGRHVQGHMLKHHEQTGHAMTAGFMDLSFWCYPCEAYISERNRFVKPVYEALCAAKFGTS